MSPCRNFIKVLQDNKEMCLENTSNDFLRLWATFQMDETGSMALVNLLLNVNLIALLNTSCYTYWLSEMQRKFIKISTAICQNTPINSLSTLI